MIGSCTTTWIPTEVCGVKFVPGMIVGRVDAFGNCSCRVATADGSKANSEVFKIPFTPKSWNRSNSTGPAIGILYSIFEIASRSPPGRVGMNCNVGTEIETGVGWPIELILVGSRNVTGVLVWYGSTTKGEIV